MRIAHIKWLQNEGRRRPRRSWDGEGPTSDLERLSELCRHSQTCLAVIMNRHDLNPDGADGPGQRERRRHIFS